jgi:hypothetical protein
MYPIFGCKPEISGYKNRQGIIFSLLLRVNNSGYNWVNTASNTSLFFQSNFIPIFIFWLSNKGLNSKSTIKEI